MPSIKCGHCHKTHESRAEVRACWRDELTSHPVKPVVHPQPSQVRYFTPAPQPAPPRPPDPRTVTKIPVILLDTVPSGRYAVQPDSNPPHTFIRVSRPTKGKFKDAFKVQTQHSDMYKPAFTRWPSGSMWWDNKSVEDALLQVIVDPMRAALEYSKEIGRCTNCGKRLTDPRSRWYGIGPECEKYRQDIMDYMHEQKGAYVG